MRKIYLIRHAKPDFPDGERYCIGSTDMPIGKIGRMQCQLLREEPTLQNISSVFSSRLVRARATAAALCDNYIVADGLEEMYAGEWDGLSFSVIKSRYTDIYERRGKDPYTPIPGSEDITLGEMRFEKALRRIADSSRDNIIVVSHSTVIQSLIARLSGMPLEEHRKYPLPYCSVAELDYDGEFHLCYYGKRTVPSMSESLALRLLQAAGCSDKIIRHCQAVCREALRIYEELCRCGLKLSRETVYYSSLLHDVARGEAEHATVGAAWLRELGYADIANVIGQHHELVENKISEAAVVNIADKCVIEDKVVTVRERFEGSRKKCSTPEALQAFERRYEQALWIKEEINKICRKEVIL